MNTFDLIQIDDYINTYKKRLKSLKQTVESEEFKNHYIKYSEQTYKQQYDYVQGKMYELNKVISDLEELLK